MKKYLLSLIVCLSILSFTALPSFVFADNLNNAPGILHNIAGKAGIDTNRDVSSIVGTGISVALSMVGLIFLVLMVYAGILWMTARGEESQVEKSRNIIVASIIGLFITVSAYAITRLVMSRFE